MTPINPIVITQSRERAVTLAICLTQILQLPRGAAKIRPKLRHGRVCRHELSSDRALEAQYTY